MRAMLSGTSAGGAGVGILTEDMKRVVREQRLGFVATVCPDGKPNLSPKGTTTVWDDDHLVFADIRSPQTLANLRDNPWLEINVVDPVARKGYRFLGTATIYSEGLRFDEVVSFYRQNGVTSPINAVVLVEVTRVRPLISPAYDSGATEDEVRSRWREYFEALNQRPAGAATDSP